MPAHSCVPAHPPLEYVHFVLIDSRCTINKISWTASINWFLRDFDVIDIGEKAVVSGHLYVRRFEASYMVVMPIIVGQEAQIRAGSVVYGGSKIGQNW